MDAQINGYLGVVKSRETAAAAGDMATYKGLAKSLRARRVALNRAYFSRIEVIRTSQDMRERAKATRESTRIAQALNRGA